MKEEDKGATNTPIDSPANASANAGANAPAKANEGEATKLDRRLFLKNSAAGSAMAFAAAGVSAAGKPGEKPHSALASEPGGEKLIGRPGSDYMVDVMKSLGLEYMASNPGSSFRSLHESMVNYGENKAPEFITCMHEETAVAMAHGYYKAVGKPMGVMVHGTVGLQHASMGLYNAWCDRVPLILFAGNGVDAATRRPGVEWAHSVQDCASLVRDFVKWDDTPMSLAHFGESCVRAYRVATTAPTEPVMIVADMDLQEEDTEGKEPPIPKLRPVQLVMGDDGALQEAARMLLAASKPVVLADRACRDQEGVKAMVAFAESLNLPVVDLGSRMNFPSAHPLCQSDRKGELIREADLILMLDVADAWGQVNDVSDPFKEQTTRIKKDTKIITIGMGEVYLKANYQDFQRFLSADLVVNGESQACLPVLTQWVRKGITASHRTAMQARFDASKKSWAESNARAREQAAVGWNISPVTTARLAMETWDVIKNEPWSLVVSDRVAWPKRLWPTTDFRQMLGGSGGYGVGYGLPAAVGAALGNKTRGRFSVTFQPDGDLLYGPGALWTAAHHKIPLLMVMHNNRGYYQEVMHLQRMASLHNRRTDQAQIGTTILDPAVDIAKLAQAYGVWAEGPISDPALLPAALRRAAAVVKSGLPALVDVVCQAR